MRCSYGWRSRLIDLIITLIILCNQTFAFADLVSPLSLSNYSPFVAVHGLPYAGDAEILPAGTIKTNLSFDISSHYAYDKNDDETVLLDGETYRTTFVYSQGVTSNVQMSLIIPYIHHRSGGLDSFINDWHVSFGMPQGGRNLVDNNQFRYFYRRNAQTRIDVQDHDGGIADVRVQAAWQMQKQAGHASAWEASVKLPTGASEKLHGSGSLDAAIWYKNETHQEDFGLRGGSFYSLGLLYLGKGDVLSDIRKQFVAFGGFGAGVYLLENLLIISQLDVNTAFYSSDLVELGSYALQLSMGGSILLNHQGRINIGVAEDLIIDASPDVTFHIEVDWRF